MTFELTAQESALIEAYRKLFPMAQEHISGLVISLAKLYTLARRSGQERRVKREAVEGALLTYELTKQEAALVRAYRKLEPRDQENARNVVSALAKAVEALSRNAAEER